MSNEHTDIASWFRVTWGPGFLVLTGDIGSMVVTHYSAAIELWDAIHWLHQADCDYLMGKTDRRQEFDAESTAREIVSRIYED